ncbi:RlpA-like double-psi beta-barrel-protein domain-containing protein-containing protein [Xylariaceae sp. FL0255]|nr:RlpA-like double-psi beta-barrel-protein domain-containing protein-containing protein [Xylariaceae sp. FL0255]
MSQQTHHILSSKTHSRCKYTNRSLLFAYNTQVSGRLGSTNATITIAAPTTSYVFTASQAHTLSQNPQIAKFIKDHYKMPFTTQTFLLALSTLTTGALAAPTSNPSNDISARGASYSGDLTYYTPGLGSCGVTNSDSDHVVALSSADYDASYCGKTITITKGGKTATASVEDKCPGCASGSIDVSSTVFEQIADLSVGRTTVDWSFD